MTHPITLLQEALVAAWRADAALAVPVFDAPPKGQAGSYVAIVRHDIRARDGDLAPGYEHRLLLHVWHDQPSRAAALEIAEKLVATALAAESAALAVTFRQLLDIPGGGKYARTHNFKTILMGWGPKDPPPADIVPVAHNPGSDDYFDSLQSASILDILPRDPRRILVIDPRAKTQGDIIRVDVYTGAVERVLHSSDKYQYDVDLNGASVQYASAGGTSWQVTNLAGTIPAGKFYLIQEAAGTGGTTNLPLLRMAIDPRPGALLIWNNSNEAGDPNEWTLHAGMPAEAGTKYIITKWYRTRKWG